MVEYLRLDDLIAIEARLGSPGIRDIGLLESALARARAPVFGDDAYTDLPEKAAALLHSLVTNHALVDGNKRLGYAALRLFLGMNDTYLDAAPDEKFDFIMAVADGTMRDVTEIATWIEQHLRS